jgi:hypothetical protein
LQFYFSAKYTYSYVFSTLSILNLKIVFYKYLCLFTLSIIKFLPAKITAGERKGPKRSRKEHWETIYRNTILARPTLKRHMGVEGAEADAGKRNPSHSMVNAMGGKNPRAPRRLNKGRKYNSNTSKDRNNRTKRLALLGRGPSK